MNQLIAVLTIVAFVSGSCYLQYRVSRGRMWSPLWLAFSASAAAMLFGVTGLIGYTLNKHDRFVDGTAWAGRVIWSQVVAGIVAAIVAAYFWRKGTRQLRAQLILPDGSLPSSD